MLEEKGVWQVIRKVFDEIAKIEASAKEIG